MHMRASSAEECLWRQKEGGRVDRGGREETPGILSLNLKQCFPNLTGLSELK